MDLAKALLKKLNDPNLSKSYTIDDFYKEMSIPKRQRSDFATAAIFKQMLKLAKNGPKPTPWVSLNALSIVAGVFLM